MQLQSYLFAGEKNLWSGYEALSAKSSALGRLCALPIGAAHVVCNVVRTSITMVAMTYLDVRNKKDPSTIADNLIGRSYTVLRSPVSAIIGGLFISCHCLLSPRLVGKGRAALFALESFLYKKNYVVLTKEERKRTFLYFDKNDLARNILENFLDKVEKASTEQELDHLHFLDTPEDQKLVENEIEIKDSILRLFIDLYKEQKMNLAEIKYLQRITANRKITRAWIEKITQNPLNANLTFRQVPAPSGLDQKQVYFWDLFERPITSDSKFKAHLEWGLLKKRVREPFFVTSQIPNLVNRKIFGLTSDLVAKAPIATATLAYPLAIAASVSNVAVCPLNLMEGLFYLAKTKIFKIRDYQRYGAKKYIQEYRKMEKFILSILAPIVAFLDAIKQSGQMHDNPTKAIKKILAFENLLHFMATDDFFVLQDSVHDYALSTECAIASWVRFCSDIDESSTAIGDDMHFLDSAQEQEKFRQEMEIKFRAIMRMTWQRIPEETFKQAKNEYLKMNYDELMHLVQENQRRIAEELERLRAEGQHIPARLID